tara:strand:- start:391 stop:558 length:168 start_codon:yes stop_codon:yes gene_type:complete
MNSSARTSCHSGGKYLKAFSTANNFSSLERTSGLSGALFILRSKSDLLGNKSGIP